MSERATAWSVTINNPTASDEEAIAKARQKGWKVEGQLEAGENGTRHYQLLVKTPQTRFSALKTAFPRAHIEAARNVKALEAYVHKDETRLENLPTQSELYPSLQQLWDKLAIFVNNKLYQNLVGTDPDQNLVIFDKFIKDCIDKGYVVETMAVNPQIRSCVKQYGENIVLRSLRRQTDRQTDKNNVVVIPQNESQVQETEEGESEDESDGWSDSSEESTESIPI